MIKLLVFGKEVTFSEDELSTIVESHFRSTSALMTPVEGRWFDVNPQTIDQSLFQEKRDDKRQEETRLTILEALSYVEKEPLKYNRPFQTLMPKKFWSQRTVAELDQLANELGDHMADWVELALEWAQRICNGESWETICNAADTANWHRLAVFHGGHILLVGGSLAVKSNAPASEVINISFHMFDPTSCCIPLVVRYK